MGFKKTFFKNIAYYGGYSYLSWIVDTIISTVILSRFLGPEEYGFVGLINVFSGFILLFSNTGLSNSVIRSPYGLKFQKIIFSLSVWIGLFLCIGLIILAYPITLIYGNKDLLVPTMVISLQFFSNSFNIVPMAILEKKLAFKKIGLINFLSSFLTVVVMIIMAALGYSYWSLIVPLVLQPVIRHIMLERATRFGIHIYGWKITKIGLIKIRTLFQSVSIFNLFNYFARNADNFAVGKFYGEASLGLYDRAYKFLYMARRLINATLGPVLFPSLIEGKSKGEDINQHFHDILGMLNVINICIALPLIFLAKPLTMILWGVDWIKVADYLPYVGVIIPLQSITIAADDLYMIDKKEKAYLTLGIPSALILVAGIVVGAFFSPIHILRFYSIAFVMVQTPVLMYFGYFRILNFTKKQIFLFWLPKVILTSAMIFSIWFGNMFITGILMALFILDTVYFRFSDIKEIFIILKASIRKKEAGNNW